MKTIQLNDYEHALLLHFLETLDSYFSNAGCNDLDLAEHIPDKEDRDCFVSLFDIVNNPSGHPDQNTYRHMSDHEIRAGTDYRLMDHMALAVLVHKIKEAR